MTVILNAEQARAVSDALERFGCNQREDERRNWAFGQISNMERLCERVIAALGLEKFEPAETEDDGLLKDAEDEIEDLKEKLNELRNNSIVLKEY